MSNPLKDGGRRAREGSASVVWGKMQTWRPLRKTSPGRREGLRPLLSAAVFKNLIRSMPVPRCPIPKPISYIHHNLHTQSNWHLNDSLPPSLLSCTQMRDAEDTEMRIKVNEVFHLYPNGIITSVSTQLFALSNEFGRGRRGDQSQQCQRGTDLQPPLCVQQE